MNLVYFSFFCNLCLAETQTVGFSISFHKAHKTVPFFWALHHVDRLDWLWLSIGKTVNSQGKMEWVLCVAIQEISFISKSCKTAQEIRLVQSGVQVQISGAHVQIYRREPVKSHLIQQDRLLSQEDSNEFSMLQQVLAGVQHRHDYSKFFFCGKPTWHSHPWYWFLLPHLA